MKDPRDIVGFLQSKGMTKSDILGLEQDLEKGILRTAIRGTRGRKFLAATKKLRRRVIEYVKGKPTYVYRIGGREGKRGAKEFLGRIRHPAKAELVARRAARMARRAAPGLAGGAAVAVGFRYIPVRGRKRKKKSKR